MSARKVIRLPLMVEVEAPEDWTDAEARDLVLFHLNLTDLDMVEVDFSAADVTGVRDMPADAALLSEAAQRLHTPGHTREGHNIVDPGNCTICRDNALAERLEA